MKGKSSEVGQTRRHLTIEEKEEIFRAYERSGLSLLAFVQREGLCYSSVLRWKRLLGSGAKACGPPDDNGTLGFVPVEIESESASGDYVLSWPGGVALRIPRQFEVEALRRLLTVLEARK